MNNPDGRGQVRTWNETTVLAEKKEKKKKEWKKERNSGPEIFLKVWHMSVVHHKGVTSWRNFSNWHTNWCPIGFYLPTDIYFTSIYLHVHIKTKAWVLSNIVWLIIYHRPFGILKKRKCTSNMRLLLSNHNDVTRPGLSLLVITTWHEKETLWSYYFPIGI